MRKLSIACYKQMNDYQNKKFQPDSNILASPEEVWGNCLPFAYRLRRFPARQKDKYKEKNQQNEKFV